MIALRPVVLVASCLFAGLASGCMSQPRPAPYVKLRECINPLLKFSSCIGLSVQEATTGMGLDQRTVRVVEEPPFEARGVSTQLGPTESIAFFIDLKDPARKRELDHYRRWTPADIAGATVVGVEYRNRAAGSIQVGDIPVGLQMPLPDYVLALTGPDRQEGRGAEPR